MNAHAIPDPNSVRIENPSEQFQTDLSLDDYLVGVIAATTTINTEPEALKAQAVIARTYALNNIEQLEETHIKQALQSMGNTHFSSFSIEELGLPYIDPTSLKSSLDVSQYDSFLEKIEQAIKETANEVILYGDQLITPLYFSSCVGMTRSAQEVWGFDIPYLKSVESESDIESTDYMKLYVSTISATLDSLNVAYQNHTLDAADYDYQVYPSLPVDETHFFDEVVVLSRDSAGYVTKVSLGGVSVSGESFAAALGLNSSCFYIEDYQETVRFLCHGNGHGLGYSQYGANAMAKTGSTYEELLTHYYTGIKITKLDLPN